MAPLQVIRLHRVPADRRPISGRLIRLVLAVVLAAASVVMFAPPASANTISRPDSSGNVGAQASMELDGSGNPVVAYLDADNEWLKLLHCYDPACANTGTNRITIPDREGVVGGVSLELDPFGNPVVSYLDADGNVRVLHCYDRDCINDGTNEINVIDGNVVTPDVTGTALALDGELPVVAYQTASTDGAFFKIYRCGDRDCEGDPASIAEISTGLNGYVNPSLALDSGRRAVVAATVPSFFTASLVVVRCNNVACTDRTTTAPDSAPISGFLPSLLVDGAGNPAITYGAGTSPSDLRLTVLRCGDAACAGGNVINQPDPDVGGLYSSLVLNAAGNPVVSHLALANDDGLLNVVRCNDPACAGGDESVFNLDPEPASGYHTTLRLDSSGYPVVGYHVAGEAADLKVAHCTSASCNDVTPPATDIVLDPPDADGRQGWYRSPVSVSFDVEEDDSGVQQLRCSLDQVPPPVTFGDLPASACTLSSVTSDGEHSVHAAAIDRVGNAGEVVGRTIRIDQSPPTTALTRLPTDPTGLNGWYIEPVTVLLGGDDLPPGSGIGETRCALDPPVPPADFDDLPGPCTSVAIATEGRHTLYAASDDVAGNHSPLLTTTANIDMTPPTVSMGMTPPTPDGENGWYVSPVQVAVSGADETSGIAQVRCVLDPGTDPGTVEDLPPPPCGVGTVATDGAHRVWAGARDVAGHASPLVSAEFKVDQTFPVTTGSLVPSQPDGDNGWYRSSVLVSLSVDDPEAEMRCALDPASPPTGFADLPGPPCTVRFVSAEGEHALYWAAKDPAGNTEALHQADFRIDATAPETAISLDPPQPDGANNWYVSPVAVSVAPVSTDVVETRCALDPDGEPDSFDELPEGPCEPVVVDAEGAHVMYAASRDEAGNTEVPVAMPFQIKRTVPVTTVSFEPARPDGRNGWYVSDLTVVVTGPEGAEVRCVSNPEEPPRSFEDLPDDPCFLLPAEDPATIARDGWLAVAGTAQVAALGDGVHVVYIASRGPAGLTEEPFSVTIRIDRRLPDLTVTIEPDEIVVGGRAEVTIDASDATSGVARARCSPLDTDGVGEKTLTCTATDRAGNVTSLSVPYTVVAGSERPPDVSAAPSTTAPGDEGGGGGDLPRSGIDAPRLLVLALTWLGVGTALVHLARSGRLRRPVRR